MEVTGPFSSPTLAHTCQVPVANAHITQARLNHWLALVCLLLELAVALAPIAVFHPADAAAVAATLGCLLLMLQMLLGCSLEVEDPHVQVCLPS